MPYRRSQRIRMTWSTYYTAILIIVGFAAWLLVDWKIYIFGYHLHHMYLGIFYLALGLFALLSHHVRLRLKLARRVSVTYLIIP